MKKFNKGNNKVLDKLLTIQEKRETDRKMELTIKLGLTGSEDENAINMYLSENSARLHQHVLKCDPIEIDADSFWDKVNDGDANEE